MSAFAPPTNRPPSFTRVRPRPGQKYAVAWVKGRLRTIYREFLAGRCDWLGETAAHLYLLLATYVLDGRFMTELIEHRELVAIMHCKTPITTTRAQRRLVERLEVELVDGGQGKAYVQFAFSKMAGPLYVESGGGAAAADGLTSQRDSEVTSQPESEASSQPESEVARTSQPESEVGRGSLCTLEEEDQDLLLRVDRFVEWWTVRYPANNDGVLNDVRGCDRTAAYALLSNRTLERVQAMALEMWAARPDRVTSSDRTFITTSDRSICVLRTKATFLEREVVRRGPLLDDDASLPAAHDASASWSQRLSLPAAATAAALVDEPDSPGVSDRRPLPPAVSDTVAPRGTTEPDAPAAPAEEPRPDQDRIYAAGLADSYEQLRKARQRAG